MRVLRPAMWVVLQDVALDAEWRDGQVVASTSARLVAEHLHIDPSTAASGLRVLRDRGIVELAQAVGPNGRFGIASYTLHLPDGIDVIRPCAESAHTANPGADTTQCDAEGVLTCRWDGVESSVPYRHLSDTVEPHAVAPHQNVDASTRGVDVLSCDPHRLHTAADPHVEPDDAACRPVRRRRSSAPVSVEQGAFDLGSAQ